MVELEIYRTVRRSLVVQMKRIRQELIGCPYWRSEILRRERTIAQDAMVDIRRLLYGG